MRKRTALVCAVVTLAGCVRPEASEVTTNSGGDSPGTSSEERSCGVLDDCYGIRAPLENELDPPEDPDVVARAFHTEGCEDGDPDSCVTLGAMWIRGEGGQQSSSTGAEKIHQGCEAGDARGCYFFGDLLERGVGVEQDPEAARMFYTRACNVWFPNACYNLGSMEAAGRGGPADEDSAVRHLAIACSLGLEQGCEVLDAPIARSHVRSQHHSGHVFHLLAICEDDIPRVLREIVEPLSACGSIGGTSARMSIAGGRTRATLVSGPSESCVDGVLREARFFRDLTCDFALRIEEIRRQE